MSCARRDIPGHGAPRCMRWFHTCGRRYGGQLQVIPGFHLLPCATCVGGCKLSFPSPSRRECSFRLFKGQPSILQHSTAQFLSPLKGGIWTRGGNCDLMEVESRRGLAQFSSAPRMSLIALGVRKGVSAVGLSTWLLATCCHLLLLNHPFGSADLVLFLTS